MKATTRQKQFLRALGHSDVDRLTIADASTLIERLLAEEKASGKTFPCPYCKRKFGPRPKRTKTCPSCKKKIIHLSGRFYTEDKVDEMNQKEWIKESRQANRADVREHWQDEKAIRKKFREQHTVGYLLRIGPNCTAASHLNGLLVLIEDAAKCIELLPPFDECREDTCECEYDPVSAHEVPRKTRIAEFADPQEQAKLKSPATSRTNNEGCAKNLILLGLFAGIVALAIIAT